MHQHGNLAASLKCLLMFYPSLSSFLLCWVFFLPNEVVSFIKLPLTCVSCMLSNTNEQTNDSFDISHCLQDPSCVSKPGTCVRGFRRFVRASAHSWKCFPPYTVCSRPVYVRLCVHCRLFAHTRTYTRHNRETKPISLCHSNTSVKLPGLFGPIKDNDTQM